MTILEEFHRNDRRVLDRLVDGELSASDRRELLTALDDEPSGWRSCALAFLEAQDLRWQLSRIAAEPIVAQLSAPPRSAPVAKGARYLAIAAGLLVAFGLGMEVSRNTEPVLTASATSQQQRAIPVDPDQEYGTPALPDQVSPPSDRWQMLTLKPVGDSASGDSIQVRVVNEVVDNPAKMLAERTPLTSTFAKGLEQAGWEVDRRQQLLPIELTDGRQVVVPIEELELRSPNLVPF